MNGDEKFWVCIWGIVCTTIVAVLITVFAYCGSQENKILKAIEAGADPVKARYALTVTSSVQDAIMATKVDEN